MRFGQMKMLNVHIVKNNEIDIYPPFEMGAEAKP